jgi:hypothetical protein
MVFPFDIESGSELSDKSISEKGFKLDMAKSRYLTIDVTKTILQTDSKGLLKSDVRFSRPAADGETYTDEGIYEFTVKNSYTGDSTTKTIYVGTSKYLKALSKNKLTLDQLNEKLAQGAKVSDNGTITN